MYCGGNEIYVREKSITKDKFLYINLKFNDHEIISIEIPTGPVQKFF
jgi:hypothetical protein